MAKQTKATAAETGNRREGGESEKKTYPASRSAIIEPEADIDADQMPSGDSAAGGGNHRSGPNSRIRNSGETWQGGIGSHRNGNHVACRWISPVCERIGLLHHAAMLLPESCGKQSPR
jgi:hypothetical protein